MIAIISKTAKESSWDKIPTIGSIGLAMDAKFLIRAAS
jgi:hypothetical protein